MIFKLTLVHAQWFIRFSEFAEFTEFPFYLGKTPVSYKLTKLYVTLIFYTEAKYPACKIITTYFS